MNTSIYFYRTHSGRLKQMQKQALHKPGEMHALYSKNEFQTDFLLFLRLRFHVPCIPHPAQSNMQQSKL